MKKNDRTHPYTIYYITTPSSSLLLLYIYIYIYNKRREEEGVVIQYIVYGCVRSFFFIFGFCRVLLGFWRRQPPEEFFFVAEIGGKRGSLGEFRGKLAEDGGDSREIYFFDWRRVQNIQQYIFCVSRRKIFDWERGYII